jgi:hypothetical protein
VEWTGSQDRQDEQDQEKNVLLVRRLIPILSIV